MLANKKDRIAVLLGISLGLLLICSRYCETTALAPIAANNIYEQQLQMHRFVSDSTGLPWPSTISAWSPTTTLISFLIWWDWCRRSAAPWWPLPLRIAPRMAGS